MKFSQAIKCIRLRWAGLLARMGEHGNTFKILTGPVAWLSGNVVSF